jgi:hypothetical protein
VIRPSTEWTCALRIFVDFPCSDCRLPVLKNPQKTTRAKSRIKMAPKLQQVVPGKSVDIADAVDSGWCEDAKRPRCSATNAPMYEKQTRTEEAK